MKHELAIDGVLTGKIKDFDDPPDVSHKGMVWHPVEIEGSDFNPETQRLGPVETRLSDGKAVHSRAVIDLTDAEKGAVLIGKRRRGYSAGTNAVKGVSADEIGGLGFWIDAIVSELEARGEFVTDEMKALNAMRKGVKQDFPK